MRKYIKWIVVLEEIILFFHIRFKRLNLNIPMDNNNIWIFLLFLWYLKIIYEKPHNERTNERKMGNDKQK